jgi:hypothetical protein
MLPTVTRSAKLGDMLCESGDIIRASACFQASVYFTYGHMTSSPAERKYLLRE